MVISDDFIKSIMRNFSWQNNDKRVIILLVQELTDIGVTTVWGSSSNVAATIGGAKFDVVLDNSGKDLEAVK